MEPAASDSYEAQFNMNFIRKHKNLNGILRKYTRFMLTALSLRLYIKNIENCYQLMTMKSQRKVMLLRFFYGFQCTGEKYLPANFYLFMAWQYISQCLTPEPFLLLRFYDLRQFNG